jgi:uncharacterized membrane protein
MFATPGENRRSASRFALGLRLLEPPWRAARRLQRASATEVTMHAHHPPLARTLGLLGLGVGIGAVAKLKLSHRSLSGRDAKAIRVKTSITIRREPEDVYRFWRELKNLPLFMRHVESVTESDGHSSWYARGPVGTKLEWDAEIVADRPNERLAWRSLEGATIPNFGSVEFRRAPRGQGTEVHLDLGFEPPFGALGASVARLFDEVPEVQLRNDLRRLKQILETGEVVHSDASIHRGIHPARPASSADLPLVYGMARS